MLAPTADRERCADASARHAYQQVSWNDSRRPGDTTHAGYPPGASQRPGGTLAVGASG